RQVAVLDQAAGLAQTGVIVAFDADDAGHRAAVGAYGLLAERTASITSLALPAGQDPAQILDDHGPAALRGTLTDCRQPLADLVIDAEIDKWTRWLAYAEGQVAALRAIAPVIAAMPLPDVARQVGRLSVKLGLHHATVTDAVTEALAAHSSGKARPAAPLVPAHGSATPGRIPAADFPAGVVLGTADVAGRPGHDGHQPGSPTGDQAVLRTRRIPG